MSHANITIILLSANSFAIEMLRMDWIYTERAVQCAGFTNCKTS